MGNGHMLYGQYEPEDENLRGSNAEGMVVGRSVQDKYEAQKA